jgi:hypothetical protein
MGIYSPGGFDVDTLVALPQAQVFHSVRISAGDNLLSTPPEFGIALKPARARKRAGSPSEGLSEDF